MNKGAKEMFEELGYEFEDNTDSRYPSLEYRKYAMYQTIEKEVSFYLVDKKIGFDGSVDDYAVISIQEIKAINQQLKELGWFNEL